MHDVVIMQLFLTCKAHDHDDADGQGCWSRRGAPVGVGPDHWHVDVEDRHLYVYMLRVKSISVVPF